MLTHADHGDQGQTQSNFQLHTKLLQKAPKLDCQCVNIKDQSPTAALLRIKQNQTVYISIRKPETCLATQRNI
jgi:hypothetical protein